MNADNTAPCRFCAECEYEVTGVTGNVCPECGTSPLATMPQRRGYRQSFWFALVVVGGQVLVWDGLMGLLSINSGGRYGGWFWLKLFALPPTVAFAAGLIPACVSPFLRRKSRRFAIELSRKILWVVLKVCYALLAVLLLLALRSL